MKTTEEASAEEVSPLTTLVPIYGSVAVPRGYQGRYGRTWDAVNGSVARGRTFVVIYGRTFDVMYGRPLPF